MDDGAVVAAIEIRHPVHVLRWLGVWAALAFVLHAVWEVGQLPLYTLAQDPDRWRVARYLLHCTLGDVLIALAAYVAGALVTRTLAWPLRTPWRGGATTVIVGMAYTVFSEWYNVYRVASWAYAPSMPLVGGIGLAPLLQWIAVPLLMIALVRRVVRPD